MFTSNKRNLSLSKKKVNSKSLSNDTGLESESEKNTPPSYSKQFD